MINPEMIKEMCEELVTRISISIVKNDSEEINNLCDDINYLDIKKQLKKEMNEWFSTKQIAQCIPQSSRWSSD